MMDFHAAMETFAEAWVAANTQTPINTDISSQAEPVRNEISTDPPTMVNVDADGTRAVPKSGMKQAPSSLQQPLNMVLAPSIGPGGVKSMPIHCIVEQVQPPGGSTDGAAAAVKLEVGSPKKTSVTAPGGADNLVVEMDTYAILPGTTMFSELVRTALIKIGYTASESMGAKGAIQIKNWKPLSFDTITDNPNCTLDEILGDLTSVATLRIRLCRSVGLKFLKFGVSHEQLEAFRSLDISEENSIQWSDEMVRCAVVDLLNEMNQSTLAKLSPLSQSTISNIANSKYMAKIGPEKCNDFGRWYTDYKKNGPDASASDPDKKSPDGIRLTFHPIYELPKMRSWFNMYVNPNDALFESLVHELNSDNVRKQRKPITVKKLKIWWRNEKARQKRILGRIERGEQVQRRKGRKRKKTESECADVGGRPGDPDVDVFSDVGTSDVRRQRDVADENGSAPPPPPPPPERSSSVGSCGQLQSAAVGVPTSPLPTSGAGQRPFGSFHQTPVYPVPYVPLGSSSVHDANVPRSGQGTAPAAHATAHAAAHAAAHASSADIFPPNSPQPVSARYFPNQRNDELGKLMLPPKDQQQQQQQQQQHPVYHHHHHHHNNSTFGN